MRIWHPIIPHHSKSPQLPCKVICIPLLLGPRTRTMKEQTNADLLRCTVRIWDFRCCLLEENEREPQSFPGSEDAAELHGSLALLLLVKSDGPPQKPLHQIRPAQIIIHPSSHPARKQTPGDSRLLYEVNQSHNRRPKCIDLPPTGSFIEGKSVCFKCEEKYASLDRRSMVVPPGTRNSDSTIHFDIGGLKDTKCSFISFAKRYEKEYWVRK